MAVDLPPNVPAVILPLCYIVVKDQIRHDTEHSTVTVQYECDRPYRIVIAKKNSGLVTRTLENGDLALPGSTMKFNASDWEIRGSDLVIQKVP